MNTFLTFLILISLLNDIFEFYCQDMLALTCEAPFAPVSSPSSTDLIFIKDVMLPEWYIKLAWSLISLFTAATTVKAVSMAIILASIAALALFYHFKPGKSLVTKFTETKDDFIEMIDISVAHVTVNKKPFEYPAPLPNNAPVEPKKTLPSPSAPIEASPYAVNVRDLFEDSPEVIPTPVRMSYADAVGYEHMESLQPRKPDVLGYDVFIADLFPDEVAHIATEKSDVTSDPAVGLVSTRRLSYADAVGYEHMETRKPNNPNVLGYDVYLGDLFPDISAEESSKTDPPDNPTIHVPARRLSYTEAVGYEHIEVRRPRNLHVLGYDVYIADLFEVEEEVAPISIDSLSPKKHEPCFKIDNDEFGQILPDPPAIVQASTRRLSYSEAVGYVNMEIRKPRYSHMIESFVYLGDLFAERVTEVTPSPSVRRLSYADVVGYANMEISRPRYSHAIESSAYLGDLIAEYKTAASDTTEFRSESLKLIYQNFNNQ